MDAGKIFICYRRDDSGGHAGRVYDRLNQRFAGRVFMDVAAIGVGTRWADVIETALRSCQVAIILIGKRWFDVGPDGVRRIDNAEDPTRIEIATALRQKMRIIPLLVSGAAVPEKADLPPDVAAMADWQALRIDDDDFEHDALRLIRALERQLDDQGAGAPGSPPTAPDAGVRRLAWLAFGWGAFRISITIGVAALALIVIDPRRFFREGPTPKASAPVTTDTEAACFARELSDVPGARIVPVESGADAQLVSPDQPKDLPIVVLLTERRKPVGALRFQLYSSNELFKIEQVLDSGCRRVEDFKNVSRGGDKHVLQNWDNVEVRFGDATYSVRLGYSDGTVSAQITKVG